MRFVAVLLAGLSLPAARPAVPGARLDPASVSLEDLAAVRGAMWTARYPMRTGPRPGRLTNILALAAIGGEAPADRDKALRAYAARGYTHGVVGAWQPDGFSPYHDVYPKQHPTFDQYLDLLQEFWDHGIMPVVFIKPDGWSCAQLEALMPYYAQSRAQKLVRIQVAGGWEPSADTPP